MTAPKEDWDLVYGSQFYQEFLAERAEVLRYKWLQSEKAGHDIGFEHALIQWISLYRTGWVQHRRGMRGDSARN